ncbi:hypothetical protein [Streptomyces niveus]|uniref:hypothetical protein n=1 Tax=Streptomyces niveus TaxID=193462 RepID=UPI00386C95FB
MTTLTNSLDLNGMVAHAASRTSYRRYTYDINPNIRTSEHTLTATVAEAGDMVRSLLADGTGRRAVEVTEYGAITLAQGTTRIRLEPGTDARPSLLTGRQAEDLLLIGGSATGAWVMHTPGKGYAIRAGFHRIPPSSTRNLVRHGWVATTGSVGTAAAISLAGSVALTWRYLRSARVASDLWADALAEAVCDAFAPAP